MTPLGWGIAIVVATVIVAVLTGASCRRIPSAAVAPKLPYTVTKPIALTFEEWQGHFDSAHTDYGPNGMRAALRLTVFKRGGGQIVGYTCAGLDATKGDIVFHVGNDTVMVVHACIESVLWEEAAVDRNGVITVPRPPQRYIVYVPESDPRPRADT